MAAIISLIGVCIGSTISFLITKWSMKYQEDKETRNTNKKLAILLKEQYYLCQELKKIEFSYEKTVGRDLEELNKAWDSLIQFKRETDILIANVDDNEQFLDTVFDKWLELWSRYRNTCKSACVDADKLEINLLQRSKEYLNDSLEEYSNAIMEKHDSNIR